MCKNILCLPYHKELEPLTRLFKLLNINVVFKYDNIIKKMLIRNSPKPDNDPGVYFIPCKGCDNLYLGQTGKSIFERRKQHRYNVRMGMTSSALFVHKQNFDHLIDWESAKVIFKSSDVTERLIVESILINKCTTMNLSEGCYKLDNILTSFLILNNKISRAIETCKSFNHHVQQ